MRMNRFHYRSRPRVCQSFRRTRPGASASVHATPSVSHTGAWQGLPERVFAPQRGAFRGSPGGFPLFSQFFRLTCISLQYARRRIVLLMLLGLLKQKKPDALSGLHSKAKIFLGKETDRAGKRIPYNLSFSKVYQNPVAKQAWIWFALRSFCKLAPSAVQTLEPPQITRDPKETFPATLPRASHRRDFLPRGCFPSGLDVGGSVRSQREVSVPARA